MKSFVGLLLLSSSSLVSAFWRMNCGNIQTGRIDPIVSPGSIAGHVHKISGPSNFGLSSTFEDLTRASCTSCTVQDDKSAYWTPKLYYAHGNGTFEEVPESGMTVYYLGRGNNRTNIVPFPPGFKMVSGNAFARSYDSSTYTFGGTKGMTLVGGSCSDSTGTCTSGGRWVEGLSTGQRVTGRPVADAVSFKCLGGNEVETPGFQYMNCPYGLRAQLHLQTCWDGVNLYKSDNSHVAHMSQIDNGMCPPTHPVQFVHLFFEVLYGVNQIKNQDGFFVFANGDKTGFGFHGDFLNGWKPETLKDALKECANTDNNGQISACAPLMRSNSEQSSFNCPAQRAIVNENVHGLLSQLPGCNPVEPGPAAARPADHVCGANATKPTVVTTPTSSTTFTTFLPQVNKQYGNWTYLGCATDNTGSRALSGASKSDKTMTNEVCQAFCAGQGYPMAGLEYGQECYCGLALNQAATLGQNCNAMICAGNSSQLCGGPARLSVWSSATYKGPRQTIPNAINATLPIKLGTAKYLGCASDNVGGKRMLTKASYNDGTKMTIESCAAFCSTKGARLAGLEYAQECYCGDALGSAIGSSSSCNMNCVGNVTEICGGPSALSVWDVSAVR